MVKGKFGILLIILIVMLSGCAGSLKIVPTVPTESSSQLVSETPGKSMEDQFRLNEPRYSVSLPQKVMLHKSLYWKDQSKLYLWLFENNAYEMMALDLQHSSPLWACKFPKGTIVYGTGQTAADDIYLDLNYHGSSLLFLDPEKGIEKWRQGKDASPEDAAPFKYFQRKFNFFVTADAIIVQDPSNYQRVNVIERFKMDRDRVGGGHRQFYNIHVYEIGDRFIVMDNGLHAVSMETGQTIWSSQFPTIATRYHTGKNVALAIVGALAGVYGGGRGPDYCYPSPLVIHANDAYYVSALSNLYRINFATGNIEWACDLGIGFANSIDVSEDRIYIASCGEYESGIFCFAQENGAQVSAFQTPFTRSVEAENLAGENLAKLAENEMWERNLACYDALIKKTGIVPNDRLVYYPAIQTKDQIVALTTDTLYAFDKQDGHTRTSLQNPSFDCAKFERIVSAGDSQIIALSKNEIAVINLADFSLAWKFDAGWTLDNIDKFEVHSIAEDLWYVHALVNDKIKGYILKKETGEMISTFEADQSLRGSDFLALAIDNRISIFK